VLWQDAKSKTTKLEQRSMHGIVTQMSDDVGDLVEGLVSSMQESVSAKSPALKRTDTLIIAGYDKEEPKCLIQSLHRSPAWHNG
jgi:hypothetical protein